MSARPGQKLRARVLAGTTTLSRSVDAALLAGAEATMFGDVPDATRMRMELLARDASTAAAALPLVVELLVPHDPARQKAIVAAITTHQPLREQWERTWMILRR